MSANGQKRLWKSVPAEMANGNVTADLPSERPLVCFLSITDQRDALSPRRMSSFRIEEASESSGRFLR